MPKSIYNTNKLKQTMLDAQRVKEERRRKHSRAGETKPKAERRKVVVAEQT
jgi:DDB1- and CUL4-associated factor 13